MAERPRAGMTSAAAARPGAARWAPLLVLFAFGLLAMAALQARRPTPTTDMIELLNRDPANLSPVFDASGREVPIESFRGKTVILNLWAPWCGPCLSEMPSLDRLARRLSDKDFAVVAVTKDPVGPSPSQETFERMGLKRLKVYLDPEGRLAPEIGSRGYPTTLILGADGALLAVWEGAADWDSDAMVARLDRLAGRARRAN